MVISTEVARSRDRPQQMTNPPFVFRRYVLTNLRYWQDYVTANAMDTPALDLKYDLVLKAISFAFKLEDAWPVARDLIDAFASFMERRGYWTSWQTILTEAIETAQRIDDKAGEVLLSALLARLLQRQSHFTQAIRCYQQTIRLARRHGDRYNEARACSNLGYLYFEQGYWWRAEVLGCHALATFEQLGSQHGQAHTENHLGILYTWQGVWDKARQHLERACVLWQAMDDHQGLMYGYMNLGILSIYLESFPEALLYSEKALYQASLVGEELVVGSIYINIALAYRLKKEPLKAEKYTRQAETIFRRFSNTFELANIQENLGAIYVDQQKWIEANSYLNSALAAWRTLKNKYGEIQTMLHFIRYELVRGNVRQAHIWLNIVEYELGQYDQTRQYYQLHKQMDEFRRSLTEVSHLVDCDEIG